MAVTEFTRDVVMPSRFSGVCGQLMFLPVRLMTASAPSKIEIHSPACSPSHATSRTPFPRWRGERVSTTISKPRAKNSFASARPMKPLPPAMTMRFRLMLKSFLQRELRDIFGCQRIDFKSALFQLHQPADDNQL